MKADFIMTAKGRATATWLDGELPFPSTADHCATSTFNELCCAGSKLKIVGIF